jgi:formate dehydrogenase subunit gamma
MSANRSPTTGSAGEQVRVERTFPRFDRLQRWQHGLLILSFAILLLTGLPQKYRLTGWSQVVLATPERLEWVQTIHHIAAIVLAFEALLHVGQGLSLLVRRRLSAGIFPTWQDVRDAGQMFRYLLFLTDRKPQFGKYSFEQKFTYWFFFFGIGIMGVTGFIIWFPIFFTRFLPGGIVPAAKLAHSTEAIVAAIFLVIWHFYHVHIQRLNLSIFTGRLNEDDMREHHALEHARLTNAKPDGPNPGAGA